MALTSQGSDFLFCFSENVYPMLFRFRIKAYMILLKFFFYIYALVLCAYTQTKAFDGRLIFTILIHVSLPFLISTALQVITKVHGKDVYILFLVILVLCVNSIFPL